MKIIFHIGCHKTGTTSIQTSLYYAKDKLLNNGILYNPIEKDKTYNHLYYSRYLNGDKNLTNVVFENLINTKSLIDKYNPPFLLLSSEDFCEYSPIGIYKLLRKINININQNNTYCIFYIRHPCELYIANLEQRIKNGNIILRNPYEFKFDIYKYIKLWMNYIDFKNMNICIYDKNICSISSFNNILNKITNTYIELEKYNLNKRLHAEEIIALYRLIKQQKIKSYYYINNIFKNHHDLNMTNFKLNKNIYYAILNNNRNIINQTYINFKVPIDNWIYNNQQYKFEHCCVIEDLCQYYNNNIVCNIIDNIKRII